MSCKVRKIRIERISVRERQIEADRQRERKREREVESESGGERARKGRKIMKETT